MFASNPYMQIINMEHYICIDISNIFSRMYFALLYFNLSDNESECLLLSQRHCYQFNWILFM